MLQIGSKVPHFMLPVPGGKSVSPSDFLGQKIVIYFYPKDNTPGCTTEAKDFRDLKEKFAAKNTLIIGVSKDSIKRHENFIAKYDLNFLLASGENTQVCEDFSVWVEKSMYGKKYMGIERSTFLIDEDGKIQKIWRKVKVSGHAEEVLNAL